MVAIQIQNKRFSFNPYRLRDIEELDDVQPAFPRFIFRHELLTLAERRCKLDLRDTCLVPSDTKCSDRLHVAVVVSVSLSHREVVGRGLQIPQNGVLT